MMQNKVYIAADHQGFVLKDIIKSHLVTKGYRLTDYGADSTDAVDYPLLAEKVAGSVADDPHNGVGILLCGSGVGVSIVANRFPHVRASLVWNERSAQLARNDDDANILCLGAALISPSQALTIVDTWFATPFAGEERYIRRLSQIAEIDKHRS